MTLQEAIENRERCLNYLIGCGARAVPENVEAVRMSLDALRAQLEQPKTPCDLCIYGGKHLGAPPCAPHLERLGCPAHPRPAGGEG